MVLAGCSGSMPTPDAGMKDAGGPDAGPQGVCVVNMPCDAGENMGPAFCFLVDPGDGGMEPCCETAV